MAENIDINKIAKIVGHGDEKEELTTEMNITQDKKQYSVRIPTKYAKLAKLNKEKDKFIFTLVSPEEAGGTFSITAELKRG
jgi:hypothetical protein